MRKQGSNLEWQIAESDAEWESLYVPPPLSCIIPGANQHSLLERSFWSMGALLLLLIGIGGWAWRTEQARVRHANAQITAQPTPSVDLWGPQRRLETPYFVYHFRQNDTLAVNAVAPQVDALYTTIRRNFGLPLTPDAEKLVIDVNVTQTPGNARFHPQDDEHLVQEDRLIVASPARYVAPVDLTDADLLAQSIALPLVDYLVAQASQQHVIRSSLQPLLNGLRLWQVWDLDLPLARWRPDIVKWLYVDLPATDSAQTDVLPDHYAALCSAHQLWMPNPLQIYIPLGCPGLNQPEVYAIWWNHHPPPTHLTQLAVPAAYHAPGELWSTTNLVTYPGQTVVLAMLIEYAVTTYGRERLPALVAGLGRYEGWETLIPTVYGISSAEFEAGWQAYLATQYGVPLLCVACAPLSLFALKRHAS